MISTKRDIWMILALVGLTIFGLFNIIGIRPDLIRSYLAYAGLSWIVYFIFSRIRIDLLEQNYKVVYAGFIFLLVVTVFFGHAVRGSKRWIDIGPISFHTAEFFKPFFLVTIASVLSSVNKFTPRKLIICVLLGIVPFLLIFKQPDLGTSLLFLASWTSILYFSGLSTVFVVRGGALFAAVLPFGWHFLKDYQKGRIIGFLNPDMNPQGLSYNLNQAIISIGSGGVIGKGLGLGTQARYRFLPEFHTDFAFASLIEQFGFIGGAILLSLCALIVYRLVKLLFKLKPNSFGYLYIIGVITIVVAEITVNVGMNMGLLPVTGIALPFISYGGASMLSTMMMLGLASNIEV